MLLVLRPAVDLELEDLPLAFVTPLTVISPRTLQWNVPFDLFDQDVTKLNTCVQRIQGVVTVPGVSSVSDSCDRAYARLNLLFVHRVSVQSFPMTSFVYATCSCLFLLYYFWYIAPKHRKFRRHLPTAGLRSCTAYSVLLDGSASFPEIPSYGLTLAPPTVAFNHVTQTLLPVFNCISALNAVSVAESECKVQTKKKN